MLHSSEANAMHVVDKKMFSNGYVLEENNDGMPFYFFYPLLACCCFSDRCCGGRLPGHCDLTMPPQRGSGGGRWGMRLLPCEMLTDVGVWGCLSAARQCRWIWYVATDQMSKHLIFFPCFSLMHRAQMDVVRYRFKQITHILHFTHQYRGKKQNNNNNKTACI